MKRVFHFSFDENVYTEDVQAIVDAARKFPNSKIYCLHSQWSNECQVFVLAETSTEAANLHNEYYKMEPNEQLKASDFEE